MKTIITSFYTLIIVLFLSSCAGAKVNKLLKEGSVKQESFKKTIPFVYANGWIVLEVEIQSKKYNFILDTGASSVLTKELAEELNSQFLGEAAAKDIKDKSRDIKFTRIENVNIGGIDFKETIAGVIDLNEIVEMSCIKIDGLIGANLMSKAVWDFDFEKQLITITNDEKKLEVPEEVITSKLFIGVADIPSVIVEINGKKTLNNTVDFGNAGSNLLRMDYFKKQVDKKIIKKYVTGTEQAFGVFGRSEERPFYTTIVEEMKIGDHMVNDLYTRVIVGGDGNLGLNFFKNYRVILNWGDKKMKMIKIKDPGVDSYSSYGFSTIYKEKSIYISSIIKTSSASEFLKQNDKILEINGVKYNSIKEEEYCDFLWHDFDKKPLTITVLRNGNELTFELVSTKLL